MAPKRARFVSSSSSHPDFDEGFDEKRFISSEGQLEYNRLRPKAVAKERGFKPSAGDGELMLMITERGWGPICDTPSDVPLGIVREFYANAAAEKNGYSWVREVTVDYSASAIRTLLRQPARPEGADDWVLTTRTDVDLDNIVAELCVPGTVWKFRPGTTEHVHFPASAMNRYARAWNLFICARLMHSSHSHDVTVERAILLWGILTDEYIDLGYLIHQSMLRFMSGRTTGAIPHASIITELCVSSGIRWADDEQLQHPSADIDSATLARLDEWSGGVPHHRGLGYIIEGGLGAGSPPQQARAARAGPSRVASRRAGGASTISDSQYRRLVRRMDTMYEINRRFAADLTLSLDHVFAADGIEVDWPAFGAHHPYPPPDSPPEEGDDTVQ